ncbi:Anaphase-promoting complex subunit 8 [Apostasia shenzhenica]|uniref:Anaphase-promoting complex subunit 8 n=1 Tax=Apostasia shenzhenica TaxID=1088818 RepID=A0A2I0B9G2_9ASPA|nr:Anaphase-promoting complex subunit 8 [Apostasia shenzhenica]
MPLRVPSLPLNLDLPISQGWGAVSQLGAGIILRHHFLSLSLVSFVSRLSFRTLSGQYRRPTDGSALRRRLRSGGGVDFASTPLGRISYLATPIPLEDCADVDGDAYLLAKTYFYCREYWRAANVLTRQIGGKATFLRCYALYLKMEAALSLLKGLRIAPSGHPSSLLVLSILCYEMLL